MILHHHIMARGLSSPTDSPSVHIHLPMSTTRAAHTRFAGNPTTQLLPAATRLHESGGERPGRGALRLPWKPACHRFRSLGAERRDRRLAEASRWERRVGHF